MSVSYLPSDPTVPIFTTPNGITYIAGGQHSNCTVEVCPVELSVYGYRPALAASSALIALYGLCIAIQLVLGYRYKTWTFMTAMLLGCVDEIIGYVGRILYYNNPWDYTGFILQIVLITLGPVFFSAAIYVLLGQIVKYISLPHSRFAPKWFYMIFIPSDGICLILQAIGGAKSASSNGASQSGVDIALAGLILQVISLVAFIALVLDFAIRSRSVWSSVKLPRRFVVFCSSLAAATLLILARCAYRIYELSAGYSRTSKGLRDQTLFIVFESSAIIIATYCMILAHPGLAFKADDEHLVKDGSAVERKSLNDGTASPDA